MAAAAAKAVADLLGHVGDARQRKRMRCASRTTWGHENLCGYVESSLPAGWRVLGPGPPYPGPD